MTIGNQSPYFYFPMIYIQIPERHDARGFLLLAKSGVPVSCLSNNIYGITKEHIKILKRKKISFKKLPATSVHLPKSPLAA